MIFWLTLALMTGAAVLAVIWPLALTGKAGRSGSDVEVYRDQLEELERDLAIGSIGKKEAEAARVEIARRLLAATDAAKTANVVSPMSTAWYRRVVSLVALLLLPAGAVGLYIQLGSPEFESKTRIAEHVTEGDQQAPIVESLVAKVEVYLQSNPEDGHGWEVLGPVYLQLGRYTDSVNAWRNTMALLGETADRQANLGEALVAEANGVVTAEAKSAFVRAVVLDKGTVSARYYLGTAAEQDGNRAEAAKIWRELIAEAPAGAHWVSDVRTALARVESNPITASGPTAADTAAAAKQPPDQQTAMIRAMVDGLATRLKQDGSDPDGWIRLVRSYEVLGETDKAQSAIADAQQALGNEPDKRRRLELGLKELGVSVVAPVQTTSPTAEPPQHADEAIPAMVNRLGERLKKSGSDPDGWMMLTRSYLTLGDKQKAAAAIKDARAALSSDPAKLQLFNEALRRFKIDEDQGAASATTTPMAADSRAPPQTDPAANEMIRGMVTRLADRLKKDGSDLDGWLQLVRSYVVLGERDKAMDAAANARQAIAGDQEKRQRLDEFVKSLGLDG
jgi:cytochrome c-type biogenesis protein CcmH